MRASSIVVVTESMGSSAPARCLGAALLLGTGCYNGLPENDRGAGEGIGVTFGAPGDTDADEDSGSNGDGSGDAADDSGGGSTGVDDDDTGDASSSSGGEIDEGALYEGAIDIVPAGVHVNQGIAITIADAGTAIAGGTRSAKIVHGRRTLVFGTWTLAPGFVPRTIRGELHLVHSDGTEETLVSELAVSGPSGPGQSDAHFTWTIEPEQLGAGTRWSVSYHELEPAPEDGPTITAPRLPSVGDSELDDEDGNQRIRVVLIPYRHQFNGCNQVAPSDETIIDGHRRAMEMQYPAQQVEITLHPEVAFGQSMATGDAVLTNVVGLRAAEAPAPDVYYYGLLLPCDASTNYGGLGYVPLSPTTVGEAPYRAAVGIYYDFAPEFTYETMVHEIGHNHGRDHVACAGTEGATDPSYPIAGGATGVLGWGIHDGVFRPASNADYMTYCETPWASTYAWQRTLAVIDALTVAVGAAPPPGGAAPSESPGAMVVAVDNGEVTAAARLGQVAPGRSEGIARWTMTDGSVAWTTVQRDHVPDSTSEFFTITEPDGGVEAVDALELDAGGAAIAVPHATIAALAQR